jgi:hypothetical protein
VGAILEYYTKKSLGLICVLMNNEIKLSGGPKVSQTVTEKFSCRNFTLVFQYEIR